MRPKPKNIRDVPAQELVVRSTGEKLTVAKSLTEPFGLKSLLVHQEVIAPGRRASSFHFYSAKEEVFYVLEGHPTAMVGTEFIDLAPGDFIGFQPSPDAPHMLFNRSPAPATVLTIGTNSPDDQITCLEGPEPRA